MLKRFCSVSIASAAACAPGHAATVSSIEAKIRAEVAAEIAGINAQTQSEPLPTKPTTWSSRNAGSLRSSGGQATGKVFQ